MMADDWRVDRRVLPFPGRLRSPDCGLMTPCIVRPIVMFGVDRG